MKEYAEKKVKKNIVKSVIFVHIALIPIDKVRQLSI